MANNKDFKVKNGIQPTVYNEAVGTVVSGSVGYSLATASYDSVSFSVSAQAVTPSDIEFKSDGTKMYILEGITNRVMYQYSLSTAFDITTASYDSVSFSVATQATGGYGLFFKGDGTSFYVADIDTESIYQYSLSTAWDLSTASYASKSFSISSQTTNPYGVSFKSDGTKMFVLASTTDTVYEYDLSTAWDVSTASYNSVSFSVTTQESFPTSLVFNDTGTKFFVGGNTDAFYEYNLSTAWDLSTASYSGNNLSVVSQESNPRGLRFNDDGTKGFVVGFTNDTVYQYSTAQTTASLDLSTGAVFDYTPTSDVQVTVSNPAASGTVSAATLLLNGAEATGVGSTFSTTLYSGTATSEAHTVTNNIDLATDGGLLWVKKRDSNISNTSHQLYDTERGASAGFLSSDSTNAQSTGDLSSFNTDGFTWNASTGLGSDYLGSDYASWTFKKAAGFFDVVTYTGDGTSSRTISHSLGTTVGSMFIKKTSTAGTDWAVYHRGVGNTDVGYLNEAWTFATTSTMWNNTTPTSSVFTIGSHNMVNQSGETYIAYIFAHDTSADSIIKCDSYTGNGSTQTINLGWEPQWLMIKRSNSTGHWNIYDTQRGITDTASPVLRANNSDAEATGSYDDIDPSSSGFIVDAINGGSVINASGGEYIYIAIRNPYIPTITYDTDLEWSGGTAPTAPAEGETDVITINTRDGGTTYQAIQAIDGAK